MRLDVLVLNSGEWMLGDELPAIPWHILIYRLRQDPRNELHLWLPQRDADRSGAFVFRRYWQEGDIRWCVELPEPVTRRPSRSPAAGVRIRFTGPDGTVLWSDYSGERRLGDFTASELTRLRREGRAGSYLSI